MFPRRPPEPEVNWRGAAVVGALALGALVLTGCATGAPPMNPTALAYARISVRINDMCVTPAPPLTPAICRDLKTADKLVMASYLTPPAQANTLTPAQVVELLGIFAGAAK